MNAAIEINVFVSSCVQLSRLLKDLKEAKEAQSPEVRLVCSLERKILNMELRHQHREKELQQVQELLL